MTFSAAKPEDSLARAVLAFLKTEEGGSEALASLLHRHPEQWGEAFAHTGVLRQAATRGYAWDLLMSLGANPWADPFSVELLARHKHEPSLLSLISKSPPPWKRGEHVELLATASSRGLVAFTKSWPLPDDHTAAGDAARLFWTRVCHLSEHTEPPEFRRGMEALWERFPVDRQHPDFMALVETFAKLGHAPQGILNQLQAEDAQHPAVWAGSAPFLLMTALKAPYSSVAHRLVREISQKPECWRDPEGLNQTPLHTVCKHAKWSPEIQRCVAYLLRQGAEPNARDDEGCTPLHRAAPAARFGARNLLSVLANAGGDLEARDRDGRSVVDLIEHPRVRAWASARLLSTSTSVSPARNRVRL